MSMMNQDYSRAKYSKEAHEKFGRAGESATLEMMETYGFSRKPKNYFGVDLECTTSNLMQDEASSYLVESEMCTTEHRWPHDMDTFKWNPLHIPLTKRDNALKYGPAIYVWWRSDLKVCACHYSTDYNQLPEVQSWNVRKGGYEWFLGVDRSMVAYWYRGETNASFWKNLLPSKTEVQLRLL